MRKLATAYVSTGLVFLALDATYLTLMADRFYRPQLGPLLREGFDLPAAIAFYFIYVAGLVMFGVRAGLEAQRASRAMLHGAAFGFVAYATYDLTNQATLNGWPLAVTLVDMTWGTIVGALACGAGCALTLRGSRSA